jgi:hypothetical protein
MMAVIVSGTSCIVLSIGFPSDFGRHARRGQMEAMVMRRSGDVGGSVRWRLPAPAAPPVEPAETALDRVRRRSAYAAQPVEFDVLERLDADGLKRPALQRMQA